MAEEEVRITATTVADIFVRLFILISLDGGCR